MTNVYGGFRLIGESGGDNFATSVADAGDINGDGVGDLIVGARFQDPDGRSWAGAGYVVFGSPSLAGQTISATSLDGTNGFKIEGGAAGDQMGLSSSYAGDVNNDGIDDVIIGAQDAFGRLGAAYVIYGSADPFQASIDVGNDLDGSNGTLLKGIGGLAGVWVSDAGDFNDDGIDDIVVNARFANGSRGESYVVYGKDNGLGAELNLGTLDGSNGFKIVGENSGDQAGLNVENAGDINNDGIDDLAIRGVGSQEVNVLYGSAAGFPAVFDLAAINGTNGFSIPLINNDYLAGLGDINNDGIDDFAVGSSSASPLGRSGQERPM